MKQCRINVVNEAFDQLDVIKDDVLDINDMRGTDISFLNL